MVADESGSKPASSEAAAAIASPALDLKPDPAQSPVIDSDSTPGKGAATTTRAAASATSKPSAPNPATVRAVPGTVTEPVAAEHGSQGPARLQPSLPLSMITRPKTTQVGNFQVTHPRELAESFESALARLEPLPNRRPIRARLAGLLGKLGLSSSRNSNSIDAHRTIAFDGFHNNLFEEKRERDRRYGTVYTVMEYSNAFLVKLELPRRMPKSSLKATWELPDEMPDYVCQVLLDDGVLTIRAGLPDEARRRLSYISPSFPSDFQTRIEFPLPVEGYTYRLLNKTLEVIVFKRREIVDTAASEQ
jgi:hypothetical protein